MITPEMVSIIKDSENCNDHGKGIYMQMVEYVSYDGEYDADTNSFIYTADGAESYADSGEMYWICGHCDRTVDWVVDIPTAEAR
jgi:hypothetical protein